MTTRTGHVVVIGGAEDRSDARVVLSRVAELAGGRRGRMVVLTTASRTAGRDPRVAAELGEIYNAAFTACGLGATAPLHVHDRDAANDPANARAIARATGVFMTGGDQSRLTDILAGTAVHRAMLEVFHERGACIAGTSAGASALSERMALGGPTDLLPRKGMLPLGPGLGFVRGVVLDQHFSERRRLPRLLSAVAQHPTLLGAGVDEDTALVLGPERSVEVLGSGAVTVLDAGAIAYTNVGEIDHNECLAISDVRMHLLPAGFSFACGSANPALGGLLSRLAGCRAAERRQRALESGIFERDADRSSARWGAGASLTSMSSSGL